MNMLSAINTDTRPSTVRHRCRIVFIDELDFTYIRRNNDDDDDVSKNPCAIYCYYTLLFVWHDRRAGRDVSGGEGSGKMEGDQWQIPIKHAMVLFSKRLKEISCRKLEHFENNII